jgi:hypothetical protein
VRDLDEAARAKALPEATALVAHDPSTAEQRWRLRRRARVSVTGHGAVSAALVELLQRAGVGRVAADDRGGAVCDDDADVTVLSGDHEPRTDVAEHLMREGRAHLVAGMRGTAGTVGPFVLPGTTPCLRCVDLTRCQLDPAWAAVRDQLSATERPTGSPAPPASAVVTRAVAALAAAEVLAHLEGRAVVTAGASAALSLVEPWPVLRHWPVQQACGCSWHAFTAPRGQWTA